MKNDKRKWLRLDHLFKIHYIINIDKNDNKIDNVEDLNIGAGGICFNTNELIIGKKIKIVFLFSNFPKPIEVLAKIKDYKKLSFSTYRYHVEFDEINNIIKDTIGAPLHFDCPLCNSNQRKFLHQFGSFKVAKCHSCSMVYLTPRLQPDKIEKYYNESYYSRDSGISGGYDDYSQQEKDLKKTYRKFSKKIKKYIKNQGRALDIGCGHGFFLEVLKEQFTDCWGLDVSKDSTEILKKKGIHFIHGNIETVDLSKVEPFDLIVMTDFIEHAYNLNAFMNKLKQIVKKDTVILVLTPNYDGLLRKISRDNWVSFKLPEHVNYFSHKTITHLFRDYGFSKLLIKSTGQYASIAFILKRVKAISSLIANMMIFFTKIFGLYHQSIFVKNGNMFALFKKD